MIQAFYSAALGAQQQMTRMGVQGNNISNVNTYGFKAEKPSFEAALYRYENGVDGAQLPRGSGALVFLSFGGLDEKEALVTCKSYVTRRMLTKPAQDVTKV